MPAIGPALATAQVSRPAALLETQRRRVPVRRRRLGRRHVAVVLVPAFARRRTQKAPANPVKWNQKAETRVEWIGLTLCVLLVSLSNQKRPPKRPETQTCCWNARGETVRGRARELAYSPVVSHLTAEDSEMWHGSAQTGGSFRRLF